MDTDRPGISLLLRGRLSGPAPQQVQRDLTFSLPEATRLHLHLEFSFLRNYEMLAFLA